MKVPKHTCEKKFQLPQHSARSTTCQYGAERWVHTILLHCQKTAYVGIRRWVVCFMNTRFHLRYGATAVDSVCLKKILMKSIHMILIRTYSRHFLSLFQTEQVLLFLKTCLQLKHHLSSLMT